MCLTLATSFKTKKEALAAAIPLIAERRMKVYKSLKTDGTQFYAPYQGMEYKEGEHYYQEDPKKFDVRVSKTGSKWYIRILAGLHCCETLEKAQRKMGSAKIQMIIPKGAEYFIDGSGNIVTDNLIWPWKD
jgi:hypothetical protein